MEARQTPPDPAAALARALGVIGGPAALGEAMGITRQGIGQWRRVPSERVLTVERLTGVPRHELRPDLYPPPSPEQPGGGEAGDEPAGDQAGRDGEAVDTTESGPRAAAA